MSDLDARFEAAAAAGLGLSKDPATRPSDAKSAYVALVQSLTGNSSW